MSTEPKQQSLPNLDVEKAKKKILAERKRFFNLHVSLIMAQEGSNVSDARAVAYGEGKDGLVKRGALKAVN